MTNRKPNAVSVLFSLILIASITVSLPGCLDVSPDDTGNGSTDGTATPVPRPSLEISLSIDTSERGRLMATTTFRNTGDAPIDDVRGEVSLLRGNETVRTDAISVGEIPPRSQARITQFYTVDRGAQYFILLELDTSLGPITKRYRLDI